MASITDNTYSFLQEYENLNYLIDEWANQYFSKENYLHVAISRKAPRLLEWTNLRKGVCNDVPVVTELALPFFDMSQYKNVVVADEAVYHGTTFEKVLSLIEEMSSPEVRLESLPVVITADALLSSKIVKNLVHGTSVIGNAEIPFYVDTVISKFPELGKPYDVEYPLFYIDFKEEIDNAILEKVLHKFADLQSKEYSVDESSIDFYEVSNYNRENDKKVVSFTYCTDYLYQDEGYGLAKPDFSKLRFFTKGNRLCVASMSPYTIPEHYIKYDSNMFPVQLRSLWEKIYSAVRKYKLPNGSDLYKEQSEKSLVMAANYLLSYSHLLQVRASLLQAMQGLVENLDFYLQKEDLTYLFGKTLGIELFEQLQKINRVVKNIDFIALGNGTASIIPAVFAKNYNYQIAVDNLREGQNQNIQMMLSSVFSSMHWQVEIESRNWKRENYFRLNFGESYASIINRFRNSSSLPTKEISRKVHRGMDERIDRGSVVPNYVRVTNGVYCEWQRLFRSGENEDVYKDQLLRSLLTLVTDCYAVTGTQFVSRASLEYILAVVYLLEKDNVKTILKRKIFDKPLIVSFSQEQNMYETLMKVGDESIAIIQYALDSDVLQLDSFDNLSISSTSYAQKLTVGCVLDKDTQETINSIVKYVLDFTKGVFDDEDDIRELLNFYFFNDERLNLKALKQSVEESLTNIIKSGISDEIQMKDLSGQISTVYHRFPDPGMSFPNQKEINIDLYNYLNHLFDNVKNEVLDGKELFEAFHLDSPLNLWSYYKNQTVFNNYDDDSYADYKSWTDSLERHFDDGTSLREWLGSYKEIRKHTEEEVKDHLLGLLGKQYAEH